MGPPTVIRVLVVDDSALVRQVLKQGLDMDSGIEVVGTASDPYMARDMIVRLNPDVMTLDVEMPRMDGVAFLRKLMPQHPLPVVMVSALTQKGKRVTLEALEAGALEVVAKPSANLANGLDAMMQELRTKVKIASTANVGHWKNKRTTQMNRSSSRLHTSFKDRVIAIGASTGGTEAIREVLMGLPANIPGTIIVQHMPPGFTEMFAHRLNEQCAALVKEAADGDTILPGQVLIAPGNLQMTVEKVGSVHNVRCKPDPPVCGHCPSVEVLMHSVAREFGANSVGVMLTGMGGDGATGLLAMRQAGAQTIAQDQSTCVVYGMPREAAALGAVQHLVPLQRIAPILMNVFALR